MFLSSHLKSTSPPALTALMARVRALSAGSRVINLAQAVVDFAPPEDFSRAVAQALREEKTHRYSPDPGWLHLRETLSGYLARSFGLPVDPERELIVTPGANQACFEALMAVVEAGDEVIIPSPWYFNHAMTVTMLGGRIRPVITTPGENYVPDPARIADSITGRTRAFIFVNPNNPTGSRYPDDWVKEIGEIFSKRNIWVISDQTYQEIVYNGDHPLSVASLPGMKDRSVTVSSFSKSLGIAGWRIGFLAGPASLVEQAIKIQDCSIISTPSISQTGLTAALPGLDAFRNAYLPVLRKRRDVFCGALEASSLIRFREPEGSTFVYLNLPTGWDEVDFSRRLLEEAGVALVPATSFGPGSEGGLRVSIGATGEEALKAGAEKIVDFTEQYGKEKSLNY